MRAELAERQTRSPAYAWAARYANQLRGKSRAWLKAAAHQRRLAQRRRPPPAASHGRAATGQDAADPEQLFRLYLATLQAIRDLGIDPGISASYAMTSSAGVDGPSLYVYAPNGSILFRYFIDEIPPVLLSPTTYQPGWTYDVMSNPVMQAVTDTAYMAEETGSEVFDQISANLEDIAAAAPLVFLAGLF